MILIQMMSQLKLFLKRKKKITCFTIEEIKNYICYIYRTSNANVPSFIDPKSRKAPPTEKFPHVYDLNSESKVSSCKFPYKYIFIYF